MRKLVVTEFVSLDGVFEAPGPDGSGFKYEGWTSAYGSDEFMKFKSEELEESEMQLLGRVTYDGFAVAWPKYKGDPFSDKFNSMPKYVVSNSLTTADWENSHIISGDTGKIIEAVKKLKEDPDGKGDIDVHGSGKLARFLLDNKLVDQLNMLVYPIILGEGLRLFEGAQKTQLELVESASWSSGITKLIYIPKK
jgi:dihydrofolate reductase